MKNKTKTYLLWTLVLFIWGIIGYKIIATINPPITGVAQQSFQTSFNPKINVEADTFSIEIANRDPFLGTLLIKRRKSENPKKTAKQEVDWMPIIYHGNVTKQDSKTNVFVVSINGQQHIMKMGQVINDVKLVRGNTKDILVRYKGSSKTIPKT